MTAVRRDSADSSWPDLWPSPPPGRAWRDLGEDERQALLIEDWRRRWPATPFPVTAAACPVCRSIRAAPAPPAPPVSSPGARDALADHHGLHALLAREVTSLWAGRSGAPPAAQVARVRAVLASAGAGVALLSEPAVAPFAAPAWDDSDGRPVLREPAGLGGSTSQSKAFFLLHRWRLGRLVAASMRDYEQVQRHAGAATGPSLRLYDDAGRVLELLGMTAGYRGEGPRGTVWVLRAAGLPEGRRSPSGWSELEAAAFGQRAFFWPPRGAAGG